ncbi:hypothetical protein HID58_033748, partial [Brassica napus]
ISPSHHRHRDSPNCPPESSEPRRASSTAVVFILLGASLPRCLLSAVRSCRPMCLLVPTATRISQRDDGEPPRRSPTTDPPSSSRFIFKSCSSSIREHDSVISQHRPLVNP